MVLSMSSRPARRWQSLIASSQFVKQEEQGKSGKKRRKVGGGMERLQVRRGETRLGDWKTGADGGEVNFSGSQTLYCFAKGATARA